MASEPAVRVTDHAQQRFQQRVATHRPGYLGVGVRWLFDEGVPVGLAHKRGSARLHPPSGAVLIYHPGDPPVIKTVFAVETVALNDDHLVRCEECGLRYDRGRDAECPWCAMDVGGDGE